MYSSCKCHRLAGRYASRKTRSGESGNSHGKQVMRPANSCYLFCFTPPREWTSRPSAVHSTATGLDLPMNTITRSEVDTKLEALSTKIGASMDSIRSKLENLSHRVEEHEKTLEAKLDLRDRVIDSKFAHLESRVDEIAVEMKDVKRTLSNQRYWIVG